ncbi:MAG TPA: hypothetical protein VIJ97_08390 [Candidatus Anoxymicrobiaceae bacterium]
MANKRIELEQYKHYVNLLEEEPNRKTARRGFLTCAIVMVILVVGFIVMGFMSTNLARNPSNVTSKPQPATSTPTGTQVPSGTQTPMAPTDKMMSDAGPAGLIDAQPGDLVAQAQSSTPTPINISAPSTSPGSVTSPGKPAAKPLPTTTSGAGNLGNLANGAGARGLDIYVLVLGIALMIVIYLGVRRVRLEGKTK